MISRMRSSPAKASVICVPIEAMLHHRRGQQAGEEDVHEQIAERHRAAGDGARAADHHDHADDADDDRGERGGAGDGGDGLGDVAEELVDAFGEDDVLALLGRVGLHHADAAEALGQAAGDLRVDLAALAEQRPHALERRGPAPPPKTASVTSVISVSFQLR